MKTKKIDKYPTGWVITISWHNKKLIKEFFTPCFIQFENRVFELHNEFIVHHKNENNRDNYKQNKPRIDVNEETSRLFKKTSDMINDS